MTKIVYENESKNAIQEEAILLSSNDTTNSLTIEFHWDEKIGKYVLTAKEYKAKGKVGRPKKNVEESMFPVEPENCYYTGEVDNYMSDEDKEVSKRLQAFLNKPEEEYCTEDVEEEEPSTLEEKIPYQDPVKELVGLQVNTYDGDKVQPTIGQHGEMLYKQSSPVAQTEEEKKAFMDALVRQDEKLDNIMSRQETKDWLHEHYAKMTYPTNVGSGISQARHHFENGKRVFDLDENGKMIWD